MLNYGIRPGQDEVGIDGVLYEPCARSGQEVGPKVGLGYP